MKTLIVTLFGALILFGPLNPPLQAQQTQDALGFSTYPYLRLVRGGPPTNAWLTLYCLYPPLGLSWSAAVNSDLGDAASFISVQPSSGQFTTLPWSNSVPVHVQAASSSASGPKGVYRGTITFTVTGTFDYPPYQWNPSAALPVAVEYVTDNSAYVTSGSNGGRGAYFSRVDAGTIATQQVRLVNLGPDHLYHWRATVTNGGAWLSVSPSAGSDLPNWQDAGYIGAETNLTLTANAAGLSPGLYQCNLMITADNLKFGSSTNPVYLDVQQVVVPPTASLIGLEVNQVVQDWSNTVPLIAGKATTVRAHLQSLGNLPARVAGQLHGFRDGSEMLPPLDPKNPGGFIMARTNAADLRHLLNNSLNFELPTRSPWTTGTVTLQFKSINSVACAEAAGTPNDCAVTVTFSPPATPQLNLVCVPWVDRNGVTHRYSRAQIQDLLIPRLISCYPVTNVDFIHSDMPWDLHELPDLDQVLDRLQALRNHDVERRPSLRIYYGVVASEDLEGTLGIAFRPGFVACGKLSLLRFPDGTGRHTHSHEIGHSLRRPHAPYCGASPSQGAPPFPFLANFSGVTHPTLGPMFDGPDALAFGYDHLAGAVVSPYQYFELMSYCRGGPLDRWPSTYTYQALNSALTNRFANPPPAGTQAAGEHLFVRGRIDLTSDAVTLEPFVTLNFTHDPDLPAPGEYSVRLLDAGGQLIQSVSFDLEVVEADGPEPTSTSFLVPVLQNPAFRQVQVIHTNRVLASRSASAHPPTVRVLSPQGGENFTGDTVNITWTGNDLDGDPLTYVVQYSRDSGATWETLNLDLTSTNYAVSRQSLRGTGAGRVRVFASDGFFTATDTSPGTFTIASNAPDVSIQSPASGTLYFGDQQMILTALAYDPQDGVLDGTNILWSSDLDGPLGSGSVLYMSAAALSEGTHSIIAVARDAAGLSASAQVSLVVQRTVPSSLADLAISQTSQTTDAGLTFTVTVENLGPNDATGLRMTDSLPPGATVLAATSTLGVCTVTNGLLTCAIDQLTFGESAVVTLQLALTAAGVYTNVADVRGVELDPVPSNNLATEEAQFTPAPPLLGIELAGNTVTISWPATAPANVVLQSSPSLSPASWSDVPDTPTNVNGRFQVTQSIANQSRYYRLLSR